MYYTNMMSMSLSVSTQKKVAKVIVYGCEKANAHIRKNEDLEAFRLNILGHLRSSVCVPYMAKKFFGKDAEVVYTGKGNYRYVKISVEGRSLFLAHDPSTDASYRDCYTPSLFPEDEDDERWTIHYSTDSNNMPNRISVEGKYGSMTIPVELAYSESVADIDSDEVFDAAVAENAPTFKARSKKSDSALEA